jgi:DNA invertase Pin-like site-specific DNA recombinase
MSKSKAKSKPRSRSQRKGAAMNKQAKAMTAAIYTRVSTDQQTCENQERELRQAAEAKGLNVVKVYSDNGVSGAKGRAQRPGLDAVLKDGVRGKYGVLMAWSVDRLGRSLPDLCATLEELHGAGVDLYLHQQGVDTRSPAGKAMFQMLGVFAEFERAMIRERVKSGMARSRAAGTVFGRPRVSAEVEQKIRDLRAQGIGIGTVAKRVGCGAAVVQRVEREDRARSA